MVSVVYDFNSSFYEHNSNIRSCEHNSSTVVKSYGWMHPNKKGVMRIRTCFLQNKNRFVKWERNEWNNENEFVCVGAAVAN